MSEKAEGYKSGVARRLRFTEQSLGRPVFQMDRLGGGGGGSYFQKDTKRASAVA